MTDWQMPPGACDCHMHFYAGTERAAPAGLGGFAMPEADAAAYRNMLGSIGVERFVAVQSIVYGTDNSVMEHAAAGFGARARLVPVLAMDAALGRRLREIEARGGRGLRAYMQAGGVYRWSDLPDLARMLEPLGWHLQLQFDGCMLPEVAPLIAALPCDVVIDHIGKFLAPVGLADPPWQALVRLMEGGRTWVKLSAPYESSRDGPPHYEDVSARARDLVRRMPERLVWATNFPHPGQGNPPSPQALLGLLAAWVPDPETRGRILRDNPAHLYRF